MCAARAAHPPSSGASRTNDTYSQYAAASATSNLDPYSTQQQQQYQSTQRDPYALHDSSPPPHPSHPTASSNNSSGSTKRTPNYAAPTTSQQLPEYSNAEAEAIRASFSTGNYRLIAHLPTELKPHHISEATAARIDDNITSSYFTAPHGSYRKVGGSSGVTGKDGLFSTFEYVPEEYSLASRLQSQLRQDSDSSRRSINPLPFLYSTPRPVLSNSLAGATSHEEAAKYYGQEKYETYEDLRRRETYKDASKILYGPFINSCREHVVSGNEGNKLLRSKLPEILAKLMKTIDEDWSDTSFQIYSDDEDLIIIQFSRETIDNPLGLLAYMNTFVKMNECVSEYGLSKLVELWNHATEPEVDGAKSGGSGGGGGGHIYYGFKPLWVKRRIEESFYVLHPEMALTGGKFIESGSSTTSASSSQQALLMPPTPTAAAASSSSSSSSSKPASQQQLGTVREEKEQQQHTQLQMRLTAAGSAITNQQGSSGGTRGQGRR